jgi:hypothetical protein
MKPMKDKSKQEGITLNSLLNLYDKEISLVAQKENINQKLKNIVYGEYIILEALQSLFKFFSILGMETIYAIIQKAFEEKYEHISVEEDRIIVKLMINIMEVMTNEITFKLGKIKMSSEEEALFVKESIKLLTEEQDNLKKEVHLLNQIIEEKKTNAEKEIENQEKRKELDIY